MISFEELGSKLQNYVQIFCPPVHSTIFSEYHEKRKLKVFLGFVAGFSLGQVYFYFLLQKIPFPHYIGKLLALVISLLLGIGNAISCQVRCISLLLFPMYCGKAGRGLLKAVILTYVISGPITNLGLNAKEVVRVFACTNEMSYNLSRTKYTLMATPFKKALFGLSTEIVQMKETLRSIRKVFTPFRNEFENPEDLEFLKLELDSIDDALGNSRRSVQIEDKHQIKTSDAKENIYQKNYEKRMDYRCQSHLARGAQTCSETFDAAFERCENVVPEPLRALCRPLSLKTQCDRVALVPRQGVCDTSKQIDPGVGVGYLYLKRSKDHLMGSLHDARLQYKISLDHDFKVVQDAKETGLRVLHAFEEKNNVMREAHSIVNICIALLSLRIFVAALDYHESYHTGIEYDNFYVTGYFKTIDQRRKARRKYTLLPLKKMERSRYVDIHSINNLTVEHDKVVNRVLKVMLEMITATTFVMLDRLFYEALDVVRQHAELETGQQGAQDMEIDVEGTGALASILSRVFASFKSQARIKRTVSNQPCVPRPRPLPAAIYLKIYGGYLWVVLLLYVNSYTLRLRSYFYPRREKNRILHLYNDILKKRLKINKTLRKKAVQAVRAYYLSGENLLSLRLKFPHLLGWLSLFPAARMKCLICGETQPRNSSNSSWHTCTIPKCPFVYCDECWREVDGVCLACDPSLAELSDVDSLTEDEQPRFLT